jgi:hypothetical protein
MKLKWKRQLRNRLRYGVWSEIGVWKDGSWFPLVDYYREEDGVGQKPIFCFSRADYQDLTGKQINTIIQQLEEIIAGKRNSLELPPGRARRIKKRRGRHERIRKKDGGSVNPKKSLC